MEYWEIADLLVATPATKEEIQAYFLGGYRIGVPKTSYEVMWERLVERLGEEEALDAVCEVVLVSASNRLRDALHEYDSHGDIEIRSSDPKIIDLLFDWDGEPTELGQMLLDYRERRAPSKQQPKKTKQRKQASRKKPAKAKPETREPQKRSSPHTHVRVQEILASNTSHELSAEVGAGWRLERVRASSGTFLKAEARWNEEKLEEHIVKNWARIDLGLDQQLELVGRQVRLKDTREKVDLLGKSGTGTWAAIELKIKPATGRDLTQLLSYMEDLAFQGVPRNKIMGILLAPSFGEKVLNAAGSDPRVRLLRFLLR